MRTGTTDIGHGAPLESILRYFSGEVLKVVAGSVEKAGLVTEVAIYDSRANTAPRPGAMMLCVGADEADIPVLVDPAIEGKPTALVLRSPLAIDAETRAHVERSGVVLLGLTAGASWMQLAVLLRSLPATRDEDDDDLPAERLGGNLFALVNAIGTLIGAPITIEDRDSRILAFSGLQNESSRARIENAFALVAPQRLGSVHQPAGVFRALRDTDRPVFIDAQELDEAAGLPQVAIAIRAGEQVLGSIWVSVHSPLSAENEKILCEGAKVAALHLVRDQVARDVNRQVREDLVATALFAGPTALRAIERLRLAQRQVAVLGMAIRVEPATESAVGPVDCLDLQRAADSLAKHLSVVSPGSVAALVGEICYAIVVKSNLDSAEDLSEHARRMADDFVEHVGNGRTRVWIGVGRVVDSVNIVDLSRSRQDANRTIRVLQQREGSGVARFHEVQMDAAIQELGDLLHAEGGLLPGPIARLQNHDRENGTAMTETLAMWLGNLGNTLSASSSMNVHPNTFRYRLRRAAEIAKIDLDNPEERFVAMLELRLAQNLFPLED